ncbi:hypothetical protein C0992_005002 [Termitomyces sp. T32_za158]|nr:hypothetical protein C0992_005002 [Termitomyces sp. T32_za158]
MSVTPRASRAPHAPALPAPCAPRPPCVPAPPMQPSFARVQEVLARLNLPAGSMVPPCVWCVANAPPLAGVYKALGGWRGVDEVVEEDSDGETTEEDELEDEGGVEGGDMQGGGEEVQVVTEGVRGMEMGRKSRAQHVVMSGGKDGLGPSKWPWSDGGRGESGGGEEGRMVLRTPASLLPSFFCVFSPLSGLPPLPECAVGGR